jgi:hypothetical protein
VQAPTRGAKTVRLLHHQCGIVPQVVAGIVPATSVRRQSTTTHWSSLHSGLQVIIPAGEWEETPRERTMIALIRTLDTAALLTWLERTIRPALKPDISNYAKGRLRCWLGTEPTLTSPTRLLRGLECPKRLLNNSFFSVTQRATML